MISRLARSAVMLTLLLAAAPSLLRLPFWVAALVLIGGGLHFTRNHYNQWVAKGLNVVLLGAAMAGILTSFDSWFSGDAVLSFFIVVVALKWSESKTRRDYLLLIFAAVIMAAIGTLYWENLLNMLHMLVVILLLTLSLVALHSERGSASPFMLRRGIQLFALAFPLMMLLFVTFPRIPGPLWDLGIAFGLPVKIMLEKGDGDFGKSTSLSPRGFRRNTQQNGNVLVAEFEGPPPFKSQLYWRGPVYYEYDGENWTLPDGWDDRDYLLRHKIRNKLHHDQVLHERSNPVRYTARVMPNGGRWMYALDFPGAPAPETFISEDFQLLNIRTLNSGEPKYELFSYLDYQAGKKLKTEMRERALSWPEGTNPRLRQLGESLAAKGLSADEIILELMTILRTGDYVFDPTHAVSPGDDALDRYFFDEKKGGSEYLAGSVTMALRAAGVPARLVSGYRGGTIIALTNFVIVKQGDAHNWVEAWDRDKGWHRVEAKDIVVTPEKAQAINKKNAAQNKPQQSVAMKQEDQQAAANNINKQEEAKVEQKDPEPQQQESSGYKLPNLLNLFADLQKWVINYDPDRQMKLLKGAGMKNGNWVDLLLSAASGVGAMGAFYLLVGWLRQRRQRDPVAISWQRFCKRLEKFGLSRHSYECPRDFLQRIQIEKPELATASADIIERYIALRYAPDPGGITAPLFKRQVERFISMT